MMEFLNKEKNQTIKVGREKRERKRRTDRHTNELSYR